MNDCEVAKIGCPKKHGANNYLQAEMHCFSDSSLVPHNLAPISATWISGNNVGPHSYRWITCGMGGEYRDDS